MVAFRIDELIPNSQSTFYYVIRTDGNKWMGLGSPTKRDSLIAESRNMSPLGGVDHARTERWSELELPMSEFMMKARHVLRRYLRRTSSLPLEHHTYCITKYSVNRQHTQFVGVYSAA